MIAITYLGKCLEYDRGGIGPEAAAFEPDRGGGSDNHVGPDGNPKVGDEIVMASLWG